MGGQDVFAAEADIVSFVGFCRAADGPGDVAGGNRCGRLREGLNQLVCRKFRIQVGQGKIPFSERTGGNDFYAGIFVQTGCLPGGEKDVAVIREDENGLCGGLVKGFQEAFYRRIHGLTAFDNDIGPHFLEGFREAFAGGHSDRSQGFAAAFETRFHVVLMVLKGHVLYLDGEKFAPLAALAEHRARILGVDVHLYDAAVAEKHQGIPSRLEPVFDDLLVKGVRVHFGALQTKEKLCAVAILQDTVFRKSIEVNRCPAVAGFVTPGPDRVSPFQRHPHPFRNTHKSCAAAVHYAGFFEHIQLLRRVFQGRFHSGNPPVQIGFKGSGVLCARNALAKHGEDGPFHRLRNGAIGFIHSLLHGAAEGGHIGLIPSFYAFGDAGKDAGEDNTGIAAGAQEHAPGYGIGHFRQAGTAGMGAGLYGHEHVVSCVSVRDREHIEVVDTLAVPGKVGGTATNQVQV